jgi:hypothetical protein
MSDYQRLHRIVFIHNKNRYTALPFCWNKIQTIKYLTKEIPGLNTCFIKEIKSFQDVSVNLKRFVLKNAFGHSAREVLVLDKVKDGLYIDKIRKKHYSTANLINIVSKFKYPFIEKQLGTKFLPYDIKVHIFFGNICFFYIYKKGNNGSYEKSRYDKKLNYINYNQMFYPGMFKNHAHFRENRNLIKSVDTVALREILLSSVKVFNKLTNLFYCSIDWLYNPVTHKYSFCELTPTPYVLSKPIKPKFIQDYVGKCYKR